MKRLAWLLRFIADLLDSPTQDYPTGNVIGPTQVLYLVDFGKQEITRCGEAAGSLAVQVDP